MLQIIAILFYFFFFFAQVVKVFLFSMGKFSSQQHFKSWLETKKSDIFLGFKSFLEDFGRRGSTKWQKNWGTLSWNSNFCPKNQLWPKLYFETYLNFCVKIGRYFSIFHFKKISKNSYRKSRFPELRFQQNWILSKHSSQ